MQNTLKMFKSIDSPLLYTSTLEELSTQYKLSHSPQILSNVFIRTHDIICNLGARFLLLSEDDISSISVYYIDYCLLNYDSANKSKFSTYLYSVLYKQFNTEQYKRTFQKTKFNYLYKTLTITIIDSFPEDAQNSIDEFEDIEDILQYNVENELLLRLTIKNSFMLTDREKKCCLLIMESGKPLSKSDMAKMLNVSRKTLYSVLKSLKTKLENLSVV